ncbi:G-type lectin S-receptor-like serine/threonine-protein kinase At4g27290 isoform X2 [Glycine soja]|uniref:G-type lectin S-receptor-like serine/threonine-protein kinase At4g27290 isoform X2 n=1 Tax=Glycine soja TaxID=3848 RepID=UPI001040256C|nr:G-type lectin S-receptor-like serine/threonine-protein kinase At4g27290 isoform X2 [Glycine soja]
MLFIWFFLFSYFSGTCTSLHSLAVNQSIRDGENETLVSAGGIIEVGFFSPGKSTRRYLGIWFKNVNPLTVVWVANRNAPLEKNSGVLKLDEKGILVILNHKNSTIWSSNISSKAGNNPIAHPLDSGNFVAKNGQQPGKDAILWQSFDYPGDTHTPGIKFGWNFQIGLERSLSSWKSVDDPAEGEYVAKMDLRGYPQVIVFKGSEIKVRVGPWNGLSLVGYPVEIPYCSQKFVLNEKEVYYEYNLLDSLDFSLFKLSPSGRSQRMYWRTQTNTRQVLTVEERDQCENYGFCGENSICNYDGSRATCECLRGYVPKSPDQWNMPIFQSGCVPGNKSDCKNSYSDGFLKYARMKLPDTSSSWFSKTMNLDECQKSCLKNCSCTAYANLDIRNGGSGCLLWFNNIVDMRCFSKSGQDVYIRVPASELDHGGPGNIKKKILGIAVGVTIFGLIITCVCILISKIPTRRLYRHFRQFQWRQEYLILRKEDMDLSTFELSTIAEATNNFSSRNKLGEGGFGPVYKGTLIDGQDVAIKRHSQMSDQGLGEFKNEVVLIAKLQHRNLVKLLGCCVQGGEKLLIYEYMSNKSLDYFIFDEARSKLLAWNQRFHIIGGIARGLLYLHQDSRLRIIHRDLKTSNILLDADMNPKISDFGLAQSFGCDQIQAKTRKVVGTCGYMPPEYAVHGHYSVKSDVFGFGVIVLEIVSGSKNRGFSDPKHSLNLLGHAWRLWTEDRPLELIDINLHERCIPFEVLRCIHVGLLCVQQKPGDRPDMSSVIPMLNGEKLLPQPKAPGFYTGKCTPESVSSSKTCKFLSQNEISQTIFEAR